MDTFQYIPASGPVVQPGLRITIETTAPNETFTLHLTFGPLNFVAHWGDGQQDTITAPSDAAKTHTYATAGIYEIRIDGTLSYYEVNNGGDRLKVRGVGGKPTGLIGYNFNGCTNATFVDDDFGHDAPSMHNSFGSWVSLVNMGSIDTSHVTTFTNVYFLCQSNVNFPLLDTSNGGSFNGMHFRCRQMVTLPNYNFDSSNMFSLFCRECDNLANVGPNLWDNSVATNFTQAFQGCALTQASVDNILASLVTAGQNGGTLDLNGGTSSAPSAAGLADVATLQGRGWTITHN